MRTITGDLIQENEHVREYEREQRKKEMLRREARNKEYGYRVVDGVTYENRIAANQGPCCWEDM